MELKHIAGVNRFWIYPQRVPGSGCKSIRFRFCYSQTRINALAVHFTSIPVDGAHDANLPSCDAGWRKIILVAQSGRYRLLSRKPAWRKLHGGQRDGHRPTPMAIPCGSLRHPRFTYLAYTNDQASFIGMTAPISILTSTMALSTNWLFSMRLSLSVPVSYITSKVLESSPRYWGHSQGLHQMPVNRVIFPKPCGHGVLYAASACCLPAATLYHCDWCVTSGRTISDEGFRCPM